MLKVRAHFKTSDTRRQARAAEAYRLYVAQGEGATNKVDEVLK